jgi:hypothetical protein
MKRLSIGAVASLFGIAMLVSAAMAARLPTSDLVVQVLSVEQVGFTRQKSDLFDHGQKVPGGVMLWETTTFVAKARIVNVIRTDHDLAAGEVIDVKYNIATTTPPLSPPRGEPLAPGQTVTVHVMGWNGKYERL